MGGAEDLHNEEWEGDVVVMLSWSDPRVAGIIPQVRPHFLAKHLAKL